ncbi:hypothetical protein F5141DRAFT_1131526 [Pisolithus sp. B1]|nr:hypothetical protein F5141DRAFT_1131526 [Pisolithus sp. B1]
MQRKIGPSGMVFVSCSDPYIHGWAPLLLGTLLQVSACYLPCRESIQGMQIGLDEFCMCLGGAYVLHRQYEVTLLASKCSKHGFSYERQLCDEVRKPPKSSTVCIRPALAVRNVTKSNRPVRDDRNVAGPQGENGEYGTVAV